MKKVFRRVVFFEGIRFVILESTELSAVVANIRILANERIIYNSCIPACYEVEAVLISGQRDQTRWFPIKRLSQHCGRK